MKTRIEMLQNKKLWTLWMPLIHVLLSCFFEWVNMPSGEDYPFEKMEVAFDAGIPFAFEQVMFCILSKVTGAALVFVLWYLGYFVIKEKQWHIMFLLAVSGLVVYFYFPNNYILEVDNLMLYVNSQLYFPDYWQSVYIGIWYNACLMVLRDAIALPLIQAWLYVGGVSYIAKKSKERWGKVAGRVPYLLLIVPEIGEIFTNPYRNIVYLILGVWYFGLLFFDFLKKQPGSAGKRLLWGMFSAYMALMRSEGILILVIFLFLLFFIWELKKKEKWCLFVGFVAVMVILMVPQKIGEAKYYGKDYEIVNYMEILQNVLSDKRANISYKGADKDLEEINRLVPQNVLLEGGLAGYRVHNYEKNGTVNQSLVSTAEQERFLQAATGVLSNNLGICLEVKITNFAKCNGGMEMAEPYLGSSLLVKVQQLNEMLLEQYSYGLNVILENPYYAELATDSFHQGVYSYIYGFLDIYRGILWSFRVTWISRLFVLLFLPVLGVGYLVKEKNRTAVAVVLVSGILLAQWGAIMLFAPEVRAVYYYPVFYFSLIWEFFTACIMKKNETAKRDENPEGADKLLAL